MNLSRYMSLVLGVACMLILGGITSAEAGSIRRIGQDVGSSKRLKNTRNVTRIGEARPGLIRIRERRAGLRTIGSETAAELRVRHARATARYRRG